MSIRQIPSPNFRAQHIDQKEIALKF